jgi:inhibitor of the pro-sigma K processing machinery
VGGGLLAALGLVSGALGIHLGVNLFNLSVIGLLGAPGLGLLLLLNWLLG